MQSHADPRDVREFEAFAASQNEAELEAALWATRADRGLTAAEQAQLQQWLQADPEHAQLFAELGASLEVARMLPADRVQELRQSLNTPPPRQRPAQHPQPMVPEVGSTPLGLPAGQGVPVQRRGWFSMAGQWAMACVLVLALPGGWLGWQHWSAQPQFAQNYASTQSEPAPIHLPDGSTLQLDVATQVQVRLYRQRREVTLLEGQALFDVSAQPDRPFHVHAGPAHVQVVGTRFTVRHTAQGLAAGGTVVAVESGRVRVSPALNSTPRQQRRSAAVELAAGQGVTVSAAGKLARATAVAPQAVAAWQRGRVNFDNTPLAEAVAEFQRYGATGLIVRDPAVAALRVGGSFDLREAAAFAQALPHMLPVRLQQRDGKTEIVRR